MKLMECETLDLTQTDQEEAELTGSNRSVKTLASLSSERSSLSSSNSTITNINGSTCETDSPAEGNARSIVESDLRDTMKQTTSVTCESSECELSECVDSKDESCTEETGGPESGDTAGTCEKRSPTGTSLDTHNLKDVKSIESNAGCSVPPADNSDELLSELETELQAADETCERTTNSDFIINTTTTNEFCENDSLSDTGIMDNCDVNRDCCRTISEGETASEYSSNIDDQETSSEGQPDTNGDTLQTGDQSSAKVQSDSSVLTSRVPTPSVIECSSASQGDKSTTLPNGVIPAVNLTDIPEYKELQSRYDTLQRLYIEKEVDIKRFQEELEKSSGELSKALEERSEHLQQIHTLSQQTEHQACEEQVRQLEKQLSSQGKDLEEAKSKLVSQDVSARKHFHQLQTELQGKLSQVNRGYEECRRDKEGMVVKYAMAEQKNIELMEKMVRNEKWVKEIEKEREQAIVKFKQMKLDREKSEGAVLARGQEIVNMRREIEKQKELRSETESKCKWANARLKQELEAHKELKGKHEDLNKRHQQLQGMMKEKQQTEEVKTMTLAVQLDEKEIALRQQQQEKTDNEEVHLMVRAELENLKRKHKEILEELRTYKDKVTCLEAERLHQEETLSKFKDTLQAQKKDHAELCQRIGELEQAGQQLGKARDQIDKLKTHLSDLEESNRDLRTEMENCAKREGGHLEFTKKVSDKNARLQSENSSLSNKLTSLQSVHEELKIKCVTLEEKIVTLEGNLNQENQQRIEENGLLRSKLEDKSRAVEELNQQLEDQKDENKTLKRRHQANIKDLSRQLQQAKRKLDSTNQRSVNGERDCQSLGSMGSRTSSINSLNTLGEGVGTSLGVQGTQQELPSPLPQEEEQPIVQFVEVDKQVLVDKIVKLQKQAARKNEKLEFMEDHINQLVEELQKKARIVQNYALREEAGTLTPEETDLNKAQLSKKGGIMASVYMKHMQDDHMTMDLSLEINRKLQAVLEDTLLKNITIKENMDTLGGEIAKLSQSNRELQLEIQQLREQISAKT